MSNYTLNISKYGTHKLISREIPKKSTVLDVGCNEGYLKLLNQTSTFFGIDFSNKALKKALDNGYKAVYNIDFNNQNNHQKINRKFKVIVFADILEHLLNPSEILVSFVKKNLKNKGLVIVSLPNVAHIQTRLKLLFGNFNYTESGTLDKTHLHLYTVQSGKNLINDSFLVVKKILFSSNRFGKIIEIFPILGSLLGYNLIYICEKRKF